jgi:hypothetical protein
VKYPGVRSALFFPLSTDIDDDERDTKKPQAVKPKR